MAGKIEKTQTNPLSFVLLLQFLNVKKNKTKQGYLIIIEIQLFSVTKLREVWYSPAGPMYF